MTGPTTLVLEHTVVGQRVSLARERKNPWLVGHLPSGWVVMSDKQVVPGQLIILADPLVMSLNHLDAAGRRRFLSDMAIVGDTLLEVTGCLRINYEILGNTDPALHAHIVPRYSTEPEERRRMPIWLYDWGAAPGYSEAVHGDLRRRLAEALKTRPVDAS